MFNQIITLINTIPNGDVDEYGDPVDKEEKRDLFCAILSIGQSEFYQAQTVGVKPQLKAVISDYLDYHDEEEAVVDGIRYKSAPDLSKDVERARNNLIRRCSLCRCLNQSQDRLAQADSRS